MSVVEDYTPSVEKQTLFPALPESLTLYLSLSRVKRLNWQVGKSMLCKAIIISTPVQFSALQFKVVSTRSGRPVCAPPRLSAVFHNVALETRSTVGLIGWLIILHA